MAGNRLVPKHIIRQPQTKKTSVRLNSDYLYRISTAMEKSGYNKKQRSRWLCEAVAKLWENIQNETHEDIKLAFDLQTVPLSEGTPTPFNLTPQATKAMAAIGECLKRNKLSYKDQQTRILCLAIEQRIFEEAAESLAV